LLNTRAPVDAILEGFGAIKLFEDFEYIFFFFFLFFIFFFFYVFLFRHTWSQAPFPSGK